MNTTPDRLKAGAGRTVSRSAYEAGEHAGASMAIDPAIRSGAG
jgi:hypothetical protein